MNTTWSDKKNKNSFNITIFSKEQLDKSFITSGKNLFVAAHGNSLRSIIMHLDGLSNEEVLGLEVPTGVPIVYRYTSGSWVRQ